MGSGTERATFGAGCFWGIEEAFRTLRGVVDTAVGYTGGAKDHPSYQEVCRDRTGHAEVVQVTYDPEATTFEALVEAFFACHDPTQLDRQGPDVGRQYRTAIFFHSADQETAARAAKAALDAAGRHPRPIATEITEATTFWPAEEHHQRYLLKRGLGSCHT